MFCLHYAAASRGCFCGGSHGGDLRTCWRSFEGFHGWTCSVDIRNAAVSTLKQELMNCGLHLNLGDISGMVLAGAGRRPGGSGGGE